MATTSEHRISVLLKLLGPKMSQQIMDGMPKPRQEKLKSQIENLANNPPTEREINDVLVEFDRFLKVAAQSPFSQRAEPKRPRVSEEKPAAKFQIYPPPELSDDPFEAINQVSQLRLVAALADETPRTVALVLNCMHEEKAANLLQKLADSQRDAVVMQLKEQLNTPLALLRRLLQATLDKCDQFVEADLAAAQEDSDKRVARLLKTMTPKARGEILEMLDTSDPEACERIRGSLFSIEDLVNVKDRTLQSILSEVDARTLAIVLSVSLDTLKERILGNLSKRARLSLEEEVEFLGEIPEVERNNAIKMVLRVMIELDKTGELLMIE